MKTTTLFAGLALIMLGGIMEGIYSLPLKFSAKWRWENIWGAGSLMALLLVPWPLAFWTVPALMKLYWHASWVVMFWALLFGAGWGVGGIFLGISIDMVGISLGFSIILGIIAINGSLTPLLMNDAGQLQTRGGVWFLTAMAIMIAGITICAIAGKRKENATQGRRLPRQAKRVFWVGLIFCIVAGLLSGLVNFALIFGTKIIQQASNYGAGPLAAINALWCLVFTANYLVNVGYCAYLLWRNRTFGHFLEPGTAHYWLQSAAMGVAWAGGIVVYGVGTYKLGSDGAVIGFPVMLATSILTANLVGWLTGEWKGSDRQTSMSMFAGIVLLLVAVSFMAQADRLLPK